MRVKRLLRFYFSADSLERAFDNVILHNACASMEGCRNGYDIAEKICGIIGEKQELSKLWAYLDCVINRLSEGERSSLEGYAAMRCGLKRLPDGKRREIKRAAVKFQRHLRRLDDFGEALGLVEKYYCLIAPA